METWLEKSFHLSGEHKWEADVIVRLLMCKKYQLFAQLITFCNFTKLVVAILLPPNDLQHMNATLKSILFLETYCHSMNFDGTKLRLVLIYCILFLKEIAVPPEKFFCRQKCLFLQWDFFKIEIWGICKNCSCFLYAFIYVVMFMQFRGMTYHFWKLRKWCNYVSPPAYFTDFA